MIDLGEPTNGHKKTNPGPRGRRVGCTAKDARGRKGSAWQALNLAPGLSPNDNLSLLSLDFVYIIYHIS